jgi:hypothetical protein
MKPGDKVVCIYKDLDHVGSDLELYKIYEVDFVYKKLNGKISIRLTKNPYVSYNLKRFVTLEQYRLLKIKKIKEKINE